MTLSKRQIRPDKFSFRDFDIEDMARSLSNKVRFGGHLVKFYSVAEHSMHVADYILALSGDPFLQFAGLLHEVDEYVTTLDIPSPLKPYFKFNGLDMHTIEDRCKEQLCKAIGIDLPFDDPIVKHADRLLCATESMKLRGVYLEGYPGVINIKLHCYSPQVAYRKFLEYYNNIAYGKTTKNGRSGGLLPPVSNS